MALIPLQDTPETPWLAQLSTPGLVLLYKHSPACELSSIALEEVRHFSGERSDVTVFMVDVLLQRTLSQDIEREWKIRHESPQAILTRDGKPVWNASHRQVRSQKLIDAVERAG